MKFVRTCSSRFSRVAAAAKAPASACPSVTASWPTITEPSRRPAPGPVADRNSELLSPPSRSRSRAIPSKPLKKLKLLFGDDERSLQEWMSIELPRIGHDVKVFPDGASAIADLERNSYDCLLVDLDMPGLSGLQVIAKAKE